MGQLSFSYLYFFIEFTEFTEFCKAQIARLIASIFYYHNYGIFLGEVKTTLSFERMQINRFVELWKI